MSSSLKYWEVASPFPLNHPKAKLFSKLGSLRRRRITVEVHVIKSSFEDDRAGDNILSRSRRSTRSKKSIEVKSSEVCYVRILDSPTSAETYLESKLKKAENRIGHLFKEKILHKSSSEHSERKDGSASDDDGESSVDSGMDSFKDSLKETSIEEKDEHFLQGWRPKYKIPLQAFRIVERKGKSITVTYRSSGRSTTREFIFDSEAEALDFSDVVGKNKELQKSRAEARLNHALGDIELDQGEELTFLIDICSGSDIPKSDVGKESDPYVSVRFNGTKIHMTDYISNEDNPIWTLSKSSLFIWRVHALELFQSVDGLIFEVKDYDFVGSNESLGAFSVSGYQLYKWNGERREFALTPLAGEKDFGKGKIALRVRRATAYDIDFLRKFSESKKKRKDINPFPVIEGGKGALKSVTTVYKKTVKEEGPDKGKTKYLVRPGPDPKRKDATTWLTKEVIEEESLKESINWIDVGSGNLGKIYFEVIGCDNLPNMDVGGVFGNKSDTFVGLVYEDCAVQTDVIDDCLSPRWLPWAQRAFIFNMMHTSSQIYLGVFDNNVNPIQNHDFIGRVSVDISNFRHNTTYVLYFNLFDSAKCGDRDEAASRGTIKIRLRMELKSERELLLSNFQLQSPFYVNVEKRKTFRVLRQTVHGKYDMKQVKTDHIWSYIDELMAFLVVYYFIEDAAKSLLLWKSTSPVPFPVMDSSFKVKWGTVHLPLHSLTAFLCLTSLVENPELFPSIYVGCIGWLLLATVELRVNHPNPWYRCKRFFHLLPSLLSGTNVAGSHVIAANENQTSVKEKLSAWTRRVKDAEEKAAQRAKEYAEEQAQYLKDLEEMGDTSGDISTKIGGFSIDPLKPLLFPIQEYLAIICNIFRFVKNVVIWEECYLSFWIAFSSLVLSIVFYFIPWGFCIKWTLRIVVWIFCGPLMKLADILYFSRAQHETDGQRIERESKLLQEKEKLRAARMLEAQIAKEKAAKLKDFKQFMFGKYIAKVDVFKFDRYYDIPLPESTASEYVPKLHSLGSLAMQEAGYRRTRVNGQRLVGEMIPKVNEIPINETPLGEPVRQKQLLRKSVIVFDSSDSYWSAVTKVGTIVVSAGAITWFGVPLLVYVLRLLIPEEDIKE